MSDRGEYRSFYCSFWDDPDVHALSDRAYRVITTLKGTLPSSGIGFLYPSQLADRCHATAAEIESALVELESTAAATPGWIVRERNIVWLVNGLRFEPSMNSRNWKHRTFVQRLIAPFGHRPIIDAFRQHYPEWFEAATPRAVTDENDTSSNANGTGIDSLPKHSLIKSNPIQSSPNQSQIADEMAGDPLSATSVAVWVNSAITERWGEQPNPKTIASANALARTLSERGVDAVIVRASIYRQCRESKREVPPNLINYFEKGIEEDWQAELTRRALATHPERPPSRSNGRGRKLAAPAVVFDKIGGDE